MTCRFALFVVALLAASFSHANWLPQWSLSPQAYVQTQCTERLEKQPLPKLDASQRQQVCQCMLTKAKAQLSFQDFVNLARLSDEELATRYGPQAKAAFKACQTSL